MLEIQMQSQPFTDPETGKKVVQLRVKISNDAVKLLQECVNGFIDGKYGDTDDARQTKLAQDLREQLHQIWRELNPS
jgi:hypothetical protein